MSAPANDDSPEPETDTTSASDCDCTNRKKIGAIKSRSTGTVLHTAYKCLDCEREFTE